MINKNGVLVDFNVAVSLMDSDIVEKLAGEGYETNQSFFTAYEEAHEAKYGEEWELSKINANY